MEKFDKICVGGFFWILLTYTFAYLAHFSPEGLYKGTGSSLEIASVALAMAVFCGIPIITAIWCSRK